MNADMDFGDPGLGMLFTDKEVGEEYPEIQRTADGPTGCVHI
jgi:hypothetical protein